MRYGNDFSAPCRPAPTSTPPLQRVQHSELEREIGFLTRSPEIHDGSAATLLQPLSGGGGLYLTREGLLAEVRPTTDPGLLNVRRFRGCARSMWQSVAKCLPEVQAGASLPRFWLTREGVAAMGAVLYGVLDVVALDVLERGNDREEALLRVKDANADPETYLRHVQWDRARAVLAAVLHPSIADFG